MTGASAQGAARSAAVFTVWRPQTGYFYSESLAGATTATQWGAPTDIPVEGDFDGDGKKDIAVWRPSTGDWYIIQSSNGHVLTHQWGAPTDIPVVGDFDGDGKADIAVWRPSTGYWYIIQSSDGQIVSQQFGAPTDVPVIGDFDGDGKTDIAVWRASTGYWYILQSSGKTVVARQFGASTDEPAAGDFDGDGKTDLAVWRPSTGYWYILQSSHGEVVAKQWGASGDIPVPQDYDGDGRTDLAVWRPSNGYWYVLTSDNGATVAKQWGAATDLPANGSREPEALTSSGTTPEIQVVINGPSGVLDTGANRQFAASVSGTSDTLVTWSVTAGGGTITAAGLYTAPALPGTATVKATAHADGTTFATVTVPLVIPEGHVAGYDVGVDYHATGADFINTAFISQYDTPSVRQTVQMQLQGMADRGATLISTRLWLVTEPGTPNTHGAWALTFPLSSREQANLHAYATDVAAIVGSGGNRLRLDLCLLWLGAADYTVGSPTTGLGYTPVSAATYTARVQATTDAVLAAISGVRRSDGVAVVDIVYIDGEAMIAAPGETPPKANEGWFMTTHYPRFVQVVKQAGFTPSVYFNISDTQADYLTPGYVDATYPELNGHRSMYWLYRTLHFMHDNSLPLPARIDFSMYVPNDLPLTAGNTYAELIERGLDDADAVLPLLGIGSSYGVAETYYFPDAVQRRAFGQAFAAEASARTRLHSLAFWSTPDGGGTGVDNAYPFAIEDYLPPPE